jgi:hypothetical protein
MRHPENPKTPEEPMRNWKTVFLASTAALAMTAGVSLSSAQGAPKNDLGGAAQTNAAQSHTSANPSAGGFGGSDRSAQGTTKQKGAAATNSPTAQKGARHVQGANRSAQTRDFNTEKTHNRAAEQQQKNPKGATAQRQESSHRGNMSTGQQQNHGRSTAERMERSGKLKGLQGNASSPMTGGANVQLSDQQRSQIRTTVIDKGSAPRVGHVDFDVRVGTVIPRQAVHVVPVPETLVRIEPEWRGYLYFVYEDEVVIVNPRDMRIVAVVTA